MIEEFRFQWHKFWARRMMTAARIWLHISRYAGKRVDTLTAQGQIHIDEMKRINDGT
jgi:hypothetical protein